MHRIAIGAVMYQIDTKCHQCSYQSHMTRDLLHINFIVKDDTIHGTIILFFPAVNMQYFSNRYWALSIRAFNEDRVYQRAFCVSTNSQCFLPYVFSCVMHFQGIYQHPHVGQPINATVTIGIVTCPSCPITTTYS